MVRTVRTVTVAADKNVSGLPSLDDKPHDEPKDGQPDDNQACIEAWAHAASDTFGREERPDHEKPHRGPERDGGVTRLRHDGDTSCLADMLVSLIKN
jgi:hypothetical protein